MRDITKLVFHSSGSDRFRDGHVPAIYKLHTSKENVEWNGEIIHGFGWVDIGYNYIITKYGVFFGRPIDKIPAHCRGHNQDSIGICLTGDVDITDYQKTLAAALAIELCRKHSISSDQIYGHYQLNNRKRCPGFPITEILDLMEAIKECRNETRSKKN